MTLIALAWSLIVAGASFTALLSAIRRRPSGAAVTAKRLVLVRPCAGHEDGLDARLAVSGGADLVLFAVESSLDPATTSAHRAARTLAARGTKAVVVHTHARGPNRKAAQLAEALRSVSPSGDDVIVIADSDVDLERTDLYPLVAMLEERGVGAAWAPPVEAGVVSTTGDRVARAVLTSSLHAFPFLAGIDGDGMVGKLFAVRASALVDANGFDPLVDRLGEDVALARALRKAGWRVRVAPVVASSVASGRRATDVIARLARWVQVVRTERPWLLPSYPLLFAPTPLAMALLGWGIASSDRTRVAAAALVLLSRLVVARFSVRDVVIGDAALLAAFVRALSTRTFAWRGRALRIGRGGRLEEQPSDEREHTFGDARDERRTSPVEHLEVAGDRAIDAGELRGERIALLEDGRGDRRIVHPSQRRPDRDPQLGLFSSGEDVPHSDRQNASGARTTGDIRGARSELELRECGALLSFGKDPHGAPRPIEQPNRVADGARAVARVIEIDAERTDEREEREPLEVSGIHHRVGGEPEEIGHEERNERIPPRRVVRDDEERPRFSRSDRSVPSVNEHATELRTDATGRVAGEPAREDGRTARRDHGRRP